MAMYPSCRFVIVACVLIGAACTGCPDEEPVPPAGPYEVGGFTVEFADASFSVTHSERADALREVHLVAGHADADVQMQFGSFRFEELDEQFDDPTDLGVVSGDAARLEVTLLDGEAIEAARLVFEADGDDGLVLSFTPTDASCNRVRLEAACDADDHFLGLGSHAMDVDHMGQAFPLWVSEPGIGKAEDEDYPDDWYFTGTRHASSYPFPFLLRPHQAHGLLIDSTARLELDLCASDADRFSVEVWDGTARFLLLSGDGPLAVVEALTETTGRIDLPEPWVFTPWNDAVRGVDRVREVAALLRESGAPSSVIWTEDWKGAEEGAFGYHLEGEWFLDEEMYPDAQDLADELEADGFKWFAYFSPFLIDGTETWDQAVADGVTILDEYGDPYVFEGVTFEDTSMVDLTSEAARAWVVEHMEAALDIGFDGWMADYAEWLPLDAVLASGEDPWLVHNDYTVRWQQLNHELLGEHDAAFFSRSGWLGAAPLAPVVWAGDQRTSFDADDGFPTVIPLGLGLSACGVPVYTHDVAGYQSVGNPPTDKELWFRWTTLGAFSPVMRTHHGAFEEDNWQFSSDEESVDHWAAMATEHVRLFPYRYGLAARAAEQGTPMVLPISFVFEGEDWSRMDAWMLGEALLVAPVLEQGATSRTVDLPDDVAWYDWFTLEPATAGGHDAAMDQIPVFAAAGTTVPTLASIPDTGVNGATGDVTTLEDVDGERVVYLFGGGGPFTEADGTTYTPIGSPSGSGETEVTLTSGTADVAGVNVTIDGPVERTYRLVVVD